MYESLKDSAYHQFKSYVAKKAVVASGDMEKIKLINEHRDNPDFALDYLIDDEPHDHLSMI